MSVYQVKGKCRDLKQWGRVIGQMKTDVLVTSVADAIDVLLTASKFPCCCDRLFLAVSSPSQVPGLSSARGFSTHCHSLGHHRHIQHKYVQNGVSPHLVRNEMWKAKQLQFSQYPQGTILRHVPHDFFNIHCAVEVLLPIVVAGLLTCLYSFLSFPYFSSLLPCLTV